MNLVDACLTGDSLTANGAITNSTSLNPVVDLFFLAGACRNESVDNIKGAIAKAYYTDALLTLKLIFWAGDVRKGAGERRFFRIALEWLNENAKGSLNKNIGLVPHFNRWDSLFTLDNDSVLPFVREALEAKDGLLAKWLPRKKQYNNFAKKVRRYTNLTPKAYRKLLVELTNVVETKMCEKEWSSIEYKKVPSVAMSKYNKAFYRNDENRFTNYIESVKKGEAKINAGAIFPHDILKKGYQNPNLLTQADVVQWDNLPNYLEGTTNKMIPVCDVSASMTWEKDALAMKISLALGIYISERNEGIFKDAFITFSGNPKMQYLKGSLADRIKQLHRSEMGYNTNLQAVFGLILSKAVENRISEELMPEMILIISDMEFDEACSNKSNFKAIEDQYAKAGYKMPSIVFWNVNGRVGNVPVNTKDRNVALVSGASPSIVKSVLSGEIDPITVMLKTLNSERYDQVTV